MSAAPSGATAPIAKAQKLVQFLSWLHGNGLDIEIQKMSPASLAAFWLGWYINDNLTRDEKESWQRQLDDEFKRSVERQQASSRSGKKIRKSAYDDLQQHYKEMIE